MPSELAIAQFISSVMLTFASVTVATVSLVFAYRNNFGWKPLALITSHGLKSGRGNPDDRYLATLSFEVWNRRKYPLILRSLLVEFATIDLHETVHDRLQPNDWYISAGKRMSYHKYEIIEPTSHRIFKIEAPFKKRTLDDLEDQITVTVRYYDPRKNKLMSIKVQHTYALK